MNHPSRLMRLACLVLPVLASCSASSPSKHQDLVVAAPTASAVLYPRCQGRCVRVVAHMRPHGSRVEALRVMTTGEGGAVAEEAPQVRVIGGASVQTISTDGNAAVIWFSCPGPRDGTCITMMVTVPGTGCCPYRIRLVPVLKAP